MGHTPRRPSPREPSIDPPPITLAVPDPGRGPAERFVADHLLELCLESEVVSSPVFRGGQVSADNALSGFDVAGYARRRNEAYPQTKRGASKLSPYIRHGLLSLRRVWEAVADGPPADVAKFRDELLWQEYARLWYARLGPASAEPMRRVYQPATEGPDSPWDPDMACLELTVDELEEDGWLVNQTRMWLASHWTVRSGLDWRRGEDYFFRHLLDGSRAANRLGWQWTTGIGSNRAYGFSRWQVEKRAPGLCASCEVGHRCPIDQWPDQPEGTKAVVSPLLAGDSDRGWSTRYGPTGVAASSDGPAPEAVWLTAESLGDGDPALAANPNLPAVFVFDRPLLAQLTLSSKRLVFLTEILAELAVRRPLELYLGDPVTVLADRPLAATFAPVPGWRRRADRLKMAEVHPWPWLVPPVAGSVASYGAWMKQVDVDRLNR